MREILVEHVHSPCLPFRELTVPRLLNGATIERIACVTQSTELDGDAENGLLLRFRPQQVRQASKGWRELSSIYEERGISTTFVGWLLCDFNRCPKLRNSKFVEKIQTMVNDRSIDGAKKRKWRKTKLFHSLVAGGDTKRALGHVQRVSQPRREQVTEGKCVQTVASRPRQL